jgi:hypothetical protein
MTSRSDAHQCEVCGAYAWHGFKLKNGDYFWYCLKHRLEAFKTLDLAPPPELKGQMTFDLGGKSDGAKAFQRAVASSRPWADCYEAYIIALPAGSDGGVAGEDWRLAAEKTIGPPPDDHVVGPVISKLRRTGDVEGTDVWRRPRDRKSKGSKKEVVRRTNKR